MNNLSNQLERNDAERFDEVQNKVGGILSTCPPTQSVQPLAGLIPY